jgi:hypothetical protein
MRFRTKLIICFNSIRLLLPNWVQKSLIIMSTSEKCQGLQVLLDKTKLSNQAMDIRLTLKSQEIQTLRDLIKAKHEMLSLQYHAINQMEKPLLVDQSVINSLADLKSLLEQKKSDLYNQELQSGEYNGKPFSKGSKLHNKWIQAGEEANNGFKDFAEGPVQDLHLQLQLQELKIQELKARIDESKELFEGLEKEAQEQQALVADLQAKYKLGLDQLELLTQENMRLKRNA